MAIKANFTAGLLSVIGDNGDDTITVNRDAAGQILINGGAISVQGDQPTLVNTKEIDVFGGNGNDTISLDNVAPPAGQALPHRTSVRRQRQRHPHRRRRQRHPRSAATATTRSLAVKAPTRRSSAPATTRSSGINGDGSDVVEGQAGFDTLDFNGNDRPAERERFSISANGSGATLYRAQGNVTIDLNSVERIEFEMPWAAADNITINDLTGTDVKQVAIDLGRGPTPDGRRQMDLSDTVPIELRPTAKRSAVTDQQRRGHGVGSDQHRDDLQLRGRHAIIS